MSSFLTKKKDTTSYDEAISGAPESTQKNKLYAIRIFEKFVDEKYSGRSISEVIQELHLCQILDRHYANKFQFFLSLNDVVFFNKLPSSNQVKHITDVLF